MEGVVGIEGVNLLVYLTLSQDGDGFIEDNDRRKREPMIDNKARHSNG